MTKRFTTTILLLVLCHAPFAIIYETFILAGQSNMDGGPSLRVSNIPDTLVPTLPNIHFFVRSLSRDVVKVIKGDSTYGPEVSFCHELARAFPKKEFLVIKYAVSATSLYAWAPNWNTDSAAITSNVPQGPLYDSLMRFIGLDTVAVKAHPEDTIRFRALLFAQGEKDATTEVAANAYFPHFREFIDSIRADLHEPKLPILFGRIRTWGIYHAPIRSAQGTVATTDLFTRMIDTDDFVVFADGVHYNDSCQLKFGKRFFDAYLDVSDEKPSKPEKGIVLSPSSGLRVSPNPFSLTTGISFELERAGKMEATVTDVSGKVVAKLFSGVHAQGKVYLIWDGKKGDRKQAIPGVYFIRINSVDQRIGTRVLLIQ